MSLNKRIIEPIISIASLEATNLCNSNTPSIEIAPEGLKDLDLRRKEAKDRIAEWLANGYSPEQIHFDGYKWRNWVHGKEANSGWSWAMWEQIQILSAKNNFVYKEKLEEQDFINKPNIDIQKYFELINPDWINIVGQANNIILKRRIHNTQSPLLNFLRTPEGILYKRYCQRILWGEATRNHGKKLTKTIVGATSNCIEFSPFDGMTSLFDIETFEDALDTEITVYRGVEFDEKPERVKKARIESWTTCPEVARLFAEGYYHSINIPGQGKVFKRLITLREIMIYINLDGEYEVILKPQK